MNSRNQFFDLDGLLAILTLMSRIFEIIDAEGDQTTSRPKSETTNPSSYKPGSQTAFMVNFCHTLEKSRLLFFLHTLKKLL